MDPAFKGLVESVDERETRLAVDSEGEGGGGDGECGDCGGHESGGEEAFECPVVGAVCAGGRREGRRVVYCAAIHRCAGVMGKQRGVERRDSDSRPPGIYG